MEKRCALIVEDSPTMRQLISFALRRVPNLAFVEAENGVEALRLVQQYRLDIVLLDINMPVMGGFTFLERLRELRPEMQPPVVVITTEGNEEDIARAQQLGAAAYITKPVQAAALAAAVHRVLCAGEQAGKATDSEV